jgi:hypothetical protein
VRQEGPTKTPTVTVSAANLQAYARDRVSAAIAYPKKRLIRRSFGVARANLTVWFTSEKFAALCEKTLVRHSHQGPLATQADVYAMDAEADGWEPPARWGEEERFASREFNRTLAAVGYRGFYHDSPSWQFYDGARAVGVQTLSSELGLPPWESGSPLRLFLHWVYAAANKRLTHAATLGLDGRGVLIAGPSGSGKSATTLAGLMHGLDSVGDDYVLVESGARLSAHSVFATVKLDREGLRRLGMAARDVAPMGLNWHGKVEFDAASISKRGLADRMEIVAILIPEIARRQRTELESATAHEAALALAPSAVLQLPGDSTEGFRFLAEVVRRLPAFRVKLSEQPAEIAETIRSFLAREGHDAD